MRLHCERGLDHDSKAPPERGLVAELGEGFSTVFLSRDDPRVRRYTIALSRRLSSVMRSHSMLPDRVEFGGGIEVGPRVRVRRACRLGPTRPERVPQAL